MWLIQGADGPLRYHNRKEGLIRGGEEEGSQGQEEEISVSAVADAGGAGSRSGAPRRFCCAGCTGAPQEVRTAAMNPRA